MHTGAYDLVDMQDELKTMFGRKVDLVQKAGIRNPFRKKHILENMKVIYVA
jgi:predicted nucleotidyltransferase